MSPAIAGESQAVRKGSHQGGPGASLGTHPMNRIARGILHIALAAALAGLAPPARGQGQPPIQSSLLLLIDVSGSMGDAIGSGNPQVKIEAAKQAAIDALGRAAQSGSVEVAVLAFAGDCQQPVPRYQDFTSDVDRLTQFVASLQPGGGTPMADALLFANRYMERSGRSAATDRMIMLLADGQNDCGDLAQAMASLQASGIIFRHETVGFGITPNSRAAQDLRQVATQTGGTYHHAADASQLADVFMEFVDTLTVIDMLGMFGRGSQAAPASPGPVRAAPSPARETESAANPKPTDEGGLASLLGGFKTNPGSQGEPDGESSGPPLWGSLAIDSNQGQVWGWSINYATAADADREALSECGTLCRIVMRFSGECAAFAADQEQGSSAHGWANGYNSGAGARSRALAECRSKGGTSCVVRSWGCTRR